MKRSARLGTAVLCASLSLGLVFVIAQAADQQKLPGAPAAAAAVNSEVPAGAPMPPDRVTPTKKLQMGVRGNVGRRLSGKEAGLPFSDFPGVKRLSSAQWARMKQIPKTGIFVVDADYVPGDFRDALKEEGYSLDGKGVLTDREGKQKAIFILPQTYELKGQRQGWLEQLQKYAGDTVIGDAKAGSPYQFACYSAQAWLVYDEGFCRHWDLKTRGNAYGPKAGGGCGWPVPTTNISSIQVWAWIHGASFRNSSCSNCSTKSVTATWDIGCFWPAHGGASFENYANLQDNDPAHGNPRADAYWVWSH